MRHPLRPQPDVHSFFVDVGPLSLYNALLAFVTSPPPPPSVQYCTHFCNPMWCIVT